MPRTHMRRVRELDWFNGCALDIRALSRQTLAKCFILLATTRVHAILLLAHIALERFVNLSFHQGHENRLTECWGSRIYQTDTWAELGQIGVGEFVNDRPSSFKYCFLVMLGWKSRKKQIVEQLQMGEE